MPAFTGVGVLLQQQGWQQDQIIKIQGINRAHILAVAVIDFSESGIFTVLGLHFRLLRQHQVVFPLANTPDQLIQQILIIVNGFGANFLKCQAHVGFIKQGKTRAQPQVMPFAFENSQPQSVKSGNRQAAGFFFTQRLGHPFFHFPGGFIGKGDRRNMTRLPAALLYQIGNFIGDHPGFARARTGQYQ